MNRRELHRQIANATGESVARIRSRGFSLLRLGAKPSSDEGDDLPPQSIDWDDHYRLEPARLVRRRLRMA